jgi:hypothetical protein
VITFKPTEDLSRIPPSDHAYPTIRALVDRLITGFTTPGKPCNWQDYGCIIPIQVDDVDRTLDEIRGGCTLLDIFREGIMLRGGFLVAI